MDKRTILYVLLVSTVFFGLNLFFSRQQDQQNRTRLAAQTAKKQELLAKQGQEIASRTASISDFPIVNLDAEHQGVLLGDALLTLAWQQSMPHILTLEGRSYQLRTENTITQSIALYTAPHFQTLELPSFSDVGSYDLQLLSFPEGHAVVTLSELSGNLLTVLGIPPKTNAIALYRQGERWIAAGIYESHSQLFIPLQDLPLLTPYVRQMHPTLPQQTTTQKYYLLQNETVQLVFTNIGGALSEINLPLKSESNSISVVNPIEFDKQIAQTSPLNARFPLTPYYMPGNPTLYEEGAQGGYYPLLRRTLKLNQGEQRLSPQHYALNIVSDYPEMAELEYSLEKFTSDTISFVGIQPHRKITKTYTLLPATHGAPYCFQLALRVDGDARGLWLTSGIPEVEIMSNAASPQVEYRILRKGKGEMDKLSLPKPKESLSSLSTKPEWVVNSNGYLGVILDAQTEIGPGYRVLGIPGTAVPTRLSLIDPKHALYPAQKYPGYEVLLPLPQKSGTSQFLIYSGPFEEQTLKLVDQMMTAQTGANPHFTAARTFYGWFSFISKPFAKMLFVVMAFFHLITHSWGFSIILLTLFLRVLLYPLNTWSIKSMRRMQKLSPLVQAIQKKYKKDPKRSQLEIMSLYREKKVNPFMGCVPILIQIPFLIAMFDLLKSSFQLRGASFIPGWIDNLTAPDVLFSWQMPIFFFGTQFHLLPFLLGAAMFLQQRITAGQTTGELTDQQRQQKAMGTVMTVVFTFMFYNFPSGLNLYWLSSMVLGIGQQWVTGRMLDQQAEKPEILEPPKKPTSKKH